MDAGSMPPLETEIGWISPQTPPNSLNMSVSATSHEQNSCATPRKGLEGHRKHQYTQILEISLKSLKTL